MIALSYDTPIVRYPLIGVDADQVPTFGPAVDGIGRLQQRSFIFRGPDGELAQADAVLHQDPQGSGVGDKFVAGTAAFRAVVVELKTDPLFGHRHERIVLQRWLA